MGGAHHFYILDDDIVFGKMLARILTAVAANVTMETSSTKAVEDILSVKPDCLLLDMMMPDLDGLEVLKRLRAEPSLGKMKIVIVSGKSYEFDQRRALAFGADGYITKPVDPDDLLHRIDRIMSDRMELTFWGVRGTLPVPGPHTVRYGGNTSCATLEFPRGDLFVFDAGTGIKALSDHLGKSSKSLVNAHILISHPHWDHINALPFFSPLYVQGNHIEIYGPAHGDISMRDMIAGQMDGVYFPINIKEFSAHVEFHDLNEGCHEIDRIQVRSMLLNHPGHCLGYRVEYHGRSVSYITDNELYPPDHPRYNPHYFEQLRQFIAGTDALIIDCTYTAEEYSKKIGWGHSSIERVVGLAVEAQVKHLYLFHHDPGQSDEDIDSKLHVVRQHVTRTNSPLICDAPREGQIFMV